MYKLNRKFLDNIFVTGGRKIIISDNISQDDLEYLYKIKHPAALKVKLKKQDDKDI